MITKLDRWLRNNPGLTTFVLIPLIVVLSGLYEFRAGMQRGIALQSRADAKPRVITVYVPRCNP